MLEAANARNALLRQPGERLRLLRDVAGSIMQTDDFRWACQPDESGPDFFLYDLSPWWHFCNGEIQAEDLHKETGVNVIDLEISAARPWKVLLTNMALRQSRSRRSTLITAACYGRNAAMPMPSAFCIST